MSAVVRLIGTALLAAPGALGERALPVLVLTLALCGSLSADDAVRGETSAAELQHVFLKAGQAYDEGHLGEAIALYEDLAGRGYVSTELFFNLGNSYFRNGRPGLAALNYRRAWQLAPRDPDVAANLRFAQDSTGALLPSPPLRIRILERLSLAEWVVVATAAYWTAALTFCLAVAWPRGRPIAQRALGATVVVLAVSLAGIAHWRAYRARPEVVITQPGQKAFFAPLEKSTAHFELPEGSVVRTLTAADAWVEVTADGKAGWIRQEACQPVSTWQLP
ncbi:MAG: hypothetical protein JXB04_05390 [Kiritimatiellae bacterium]|nr:hypothetical protein [Kiritimatiellia bacterium]